MAHMLYVWTMNKITQFCGFLNIYIYILPQYRSLFPYLYIYIYSMSSCNLCSLLLRHHGPMGVWIPRGVPKIGAAQSHPFDIIHWIAWRGNLQETTFCIFVYHRIWGFLQVFQKIPRKSHESYVIWIINHPAIGVPFMEPINFCQPSRPPAPWGVSGRVKMAVLMFSPVSAWRQNGAPVRNPGTCGCKGSWPSDMDTPWYIYIYIYKSYHI